MVMVLSLRPNLTLDAERSRRMMRTLEIVTKYKNGVLVDDIADDYGASRSTISRIVKMMGIPKRPRHFPEEIRDNVITAYKKNKPIKEIAELYNVSESYISTQAAKEGILRIPKPRAKK